MCFLPSTPFHVMVANIHLIYSAINWYKHSNYADVYTDLEKIAHMQYFSFRVFVSGLHSNSKINNNARGEEDEKDQDDNVKLEDDSIKLLTVQYVVANAHAVSYPEACK